MFGGRVAQDAVRKQASVAQENANLIRIPGMDSTSRPLSAVSQASAWSALALGAGAFSLSKVQAFPPKLALFLICSGIALPFVVGELPRIIEAARKDWQPNIARVAVKAVGLAALLAGLCAAYIVFRGFAENFVLPLLPHGPWWYAGLCVLALVYLFVADALLPEKQDELWEIGSGTLKGFPAPLSDAARQYVLGWVLKGFFAPLMVTFALSNLKNLLPLDLAATFRDQAAGFSLIFDGLYFIDVGFASIGYLATLKLLNTHIKTIQTTLLGWVICLVCYPPFWPAVWQNFLNYDDGLEWGAWLWETPVLWYAWGAAVLFCVAVYAWATLSFGIRFSNLTNRGIITNGPYRFVKHPAYIAKCVSFWLIAIPFIPHGSPAAAIGNCVALALGNLIYVVRARTEEAQLMQDADYRAYSAWIDQHGLVARLARRFPRLARARGAA